MKASSLFPALATILALTGCSPKSSEHMERSVHSDTVRLSTIRSDTVRVGDTLRIFVRERGDTVTIWREAVRWRTQVREIHDTLWASRRDTLIRTEKVAVGRPPEIGDWLWPMLTGAIAGASAAVFLLADKDKRSKK